MAPVVEPPPLLDEALLELDDDALLELDDEVPLDDDDALLLLLDDEAPLLDEVAPLLLDADDPPLDASPPVEDPLPPPDDAELEVLAAPVAVALEVPRTDASEQAVSPAAATTGIRRQSVRIGRL